LFFLVLLALSAGASSAWSLGDDSPSGKISDPEVIEEVQEVAPVEVASGSPLLTLLGRMHPALVHFPIGWVVLLLIVDLADMWRGREECSRAGLFILVLACLSFFPATITGLLLAGSMPSDPEFRSMMVLHKNLNISAGGVCLGALAFRLGWAGKGGRAARWAYVSLVAGSAALLLVAGHLGGKMAFGSAYLPF